MSEFYDGTKLLSLLDRKENLKLTNFSMLNKYQEICKKSKIYNSRWWIDRRKW